MNILYIDEYGNQTAAVQVCPPAVGDTVDILSTEYTVQSICWFLANNTAKVFISESSVKPRDTLDESDDKRHKQQIATLTKKQQITEKQLSELTHQVESLRYAVKHQAKK